ADRRIDVTARDRNLAAKEVTEGTGFRRQVDGRLGPVAAQHPRPWMPEARATRRQRNDERQRDGEASPGHRSCGTTMADALRQFKRKAGYRFRREWTLVAHHAPRRGVRAHRREIHLGSGPDARVERSVTRARRMSRPAKAGATDKGTPAPPTPLWRYLSSTPKAGGFTAAAASADRAMRAGRVPRMPRWLRQPRHGSRAWYCPFTLASGSDPRHESRVALLARTPSGPQVSDFSDCFLLVFGQLAVGGLAALAVPPFAVLQRGFYKSSACVFLGCALLFIVGRATLAVRAGDLISGRAVELALWTTFAAALAAYLASLWGEEPRLRARTYPAALFFGVAALCASALAHRLGTVGSAAALLYPLSFLTGALALGAVATGMLLGHWYLI